MFLNLDRSRRRRAPGSSAESSVDPATAHPETFATAIRRQGPRVARPEPGIYLLQVATSRIGFRQWSHPRTPQSNPSLAHDAPVRHSTNQKEGLRWRSCRAFFMSPCWLPAVLSVGRQGRLPIPIRGITTSRRNRRTSARRRGWWHESTAPQQGQPLSCAGTLTKRLRALRSRQHTMAAIAKHFGVRHTTVSRMAGGTKIR